MDGIDRDTLATKKPAMPKDDADVQAMHSVLILQHREIETLKRKLKSERAAARFIKAEVELKARCTQQWGAAPLPVIPDDMLARLIRLVHPDRHGNSAASNEAMAWLLSKRGMTLK